MIFVIAAAPPGAASMAAACFEHKCFVARTLDLFHGFYNPVLRALTHSQHRAANVKERPYAQSDDWPLSHVRGSGL